MARKSRTRQRKKLSDLLNQNINIIERAREAVIAAENPAVQIFDEPVHEEHAPQNELAALFEANEHQPQAPNVNEWSPYGPVDGASEGLPDEVEEIPEPLQAPEPIIIHAQNGNDLYWSEAQNRWLIVGIPEEEQLPPPPRLRAEVGYIQVPRDRPLAEHYFAAAPANPEPAARTAKKVSYEKSVTRGTEPMYFEDLDNHNKISVMKREFVTLVKAVFDNPESLKIYVTDKLLSKDQAKQIFKSLNKLNANKCPCCRRFDANLIPAPIDKSFEPLIDIAQTKAKSRSY